MKHARTGVLAAALVALSVESYAQGVDIGKREYANAAPFAMGTVGEEMARLQGISRPKFNSPIDSEAFVRDRILALIHYISSLQVK